MRQLEIPTHFRINLVTETITPDDLADINRKLESIDMKVSELANTLRDVRTSLVEASQEINEKLSELGSADPDLSPEGAQLLQEIKDQAKSLADIVPPKVVESLPPAGPAEPAPVEPAPAPPEGEQPPA